MKIIKAFNRQDFEKIFRPKRTKELSNECIERLFCDTDGWGEGSRRFQKKRKR
jgi:hypothetical protein